MACCPYHVSGDATWRAGGEGQGGPVVVSVGTLVETRGLTCKKTVRRLWRSTKGRHLLQRLLLVTNPGGARLPGKGRERSGPSPPPPPRRPPHRRKSLSLPLASVRNECPTLCNTTIHSHALRAGGGAGRRLADYGPLGNRHGWRRFTAQRWRSIVFTPAVAQSLAAARPPPASRVGLALVVPTGLSKGFGGGIAPHNGGQDWVVYGPFVGGHGQGCTGTEVLEGGGSAFPPPPPPWVLQHL